MFAMGGLIILQVGQDLGVLSSTTFIERLSGQSLTSLELAVTWSLVGVVLYATRRARVRREASASSGGDGAS